MAVSMVVTPEPDNLPPRVRIDLDTNDPTRAFTDIVIRRNGQVIRSVAPTGSDVSVVFDYDCPFGVPVTYTVDGHDGGFNTELNVTWPNLSGWTTTPDSPATPTVGSGHLTAGTVERTIAGVDRITIHNANLFGGGIDFQYDFGGLSDFNMVSLLGLGGTIIVQDLTNGWSVEVASGSGDWTMTGNQVESTLGSTTLPSGGFNGTAAGFINQVQPTAGTGGLVPAFAVYTGTSPADFSLSDDTQLDALEAWLIHPINPDLSISIDPNRRRWTGVNVLRSSADQITRPSSRTVFNPVGRARSVVVVNGDRGPGDWNLDLFAPTLADRDAIVAITRDQSPLLLRIPPAWGWDLPDDWYSVDTTDDNRILRQPDTDTTYRTIRLPLTPVDPPILTQGAAWTYSDVLITYTSYDEVRMTYDTYLDLLVGPQ